MSNGILAFVAFAFLAAAAAAQVARPGAPADLGTTEREALQAVNAIFNSIDTLQGQFVQYGPGPDDRLEGRFYFARPGRLRLDYDPPSQQVVISDGVMVLVRDPQRGTENFERLDRTPLAPILAQNTDLTSPRLLSDVILDLGGYIAVVLAPADSRSWLTLYFDPETYELRSWLTVDPRGNRISFVIFNEVTNRPIAAELFSIGN